MKRFIAFASAAMLVLGLAFFLASCGKSSSSDTTPAPSGVISTATLTLLPASAATTTMSMGGGAATVNFLFSANTVSQQTAITVTEVPATALPAPINSASLGDFSLNAGNTYVLGFTISTNLNITSFNVPVSLGGSVALSSLVTPGTTLNLAILQNNTWVDVSTVTVGSSGALIQSLISTTLPGIVTPGTYILYLPAAGTSTSVSNLGIALIADDGHGYSSAYGKNSLQVINLYDASGKPLATPAVKHLDYTSAGDMDGQALTPSGSQGILVDGGNTIRFFSNVQTGVPTASTTTLDVSAYGGDGDSVAIMPNGDEAVVSGDSSSVLLLVSGIASGNPMSAATIAIPGYRDGVVISNDGKVLLARGSSGLTVFAIAPVTPAAGPLGGTVSHSFTQKADIASLGSNWEDGRNGIAVSPKDSGRAVIIGSGYAANATLVTGLTTSVTVASPVTLTGVTSVRSVTITPDGKTAIVGTNAGIVMLSGVDTDTLTQVGTNYAPTYAGASGNVTMGTVPTLGVTLDGKYAVVCDSGTSYAGTGAGSLLVIPITATGFSAPVGILNGIAVPDNDQMVIH